MASKRCSRLAMSVAHAPGPEPAPRTVPELVLAWPPELLAPAHHNMCPAPEAPPSCTPAAPMALGGSSRCASRSRPLWTTWIRSRRMLKAPACGRSMARPRRHLRRAGCLRGSSSRKRSREKTGDSRRCTSWSSCFSRSRVGSKAAKRAVSSVASSYCCAQRQRASALTGLWNHGSRSSKKSGRPAGLSSGAAWPAWAAWPSSESGAVASSSSLRLFVSVAVSRIQLKVCTSCWANSTSVSCWIARATVT
mmetsp:Transcript_71279/g.230863  ORF Transcript_71279/g.230863 Transcript_71279/m.230863 type:complete len:250 (+) Transcript_71279:44-793(+)